MTHVTKHTDGKVGGYLVGRRHSQGGIQAVNVDSGTPLEVEADEVVITRSAVLSPETHEFDGEQLTNLEILSKINQAGGGVALMESGGQVEDPYRCRCSGKRYQFGGREQTDREIVSHIQHSFDENCVDNQKRQLTAVQAALPFSRGENRQFLLKKEKTLTLHLKSASYG